MKRQVIQDGYGNNTGVFVPITDWEVITQKHQDLKGLVNIEPGPKKKLSELAGALSKETGEAMLISRNTSDFTNIQGLHVIDPYSSIGRL
ncbi:MAG: hypothetical protein ACHQIM_10240 [Sphingobacteriales bacterium]